LEKSKIIESPAYSFLTDRVQISANKILCSTFH